MDVEQSKAIDAVERRAKTLERNPKGYQKDMTLRMNRELLQDLYELFRFWECCQDELPSGAQRDMPKWEYFADAASEVEGTLNLWPQPKSQPVRNCLECGQPITAGQRMVALVDFDHVGAYATVRHRDCANA